MRSTKISVVSKKTANCPSCGNPIGETWQLCPSCGVDLTPTSLQKATNVGAIDSIGVPDIKRKIPELPNTQIGSIVVILLFILTALGEYLVLPTAYLSTFGILLGSSGIIYWFYCVSRIHQVLSHQTNGTYRIGPGKAVWLHLIPVYDLYWIFHWSNYLIGFLNESKTRRIRKGGMGVLILLGLIITSIGLYLTAQPNGNLALSIAAFGILLMQGVLNFFCAELSFQYSGNNLGISIKKSFVLENELVKQNWLSLWWICNLLIILPIIFSKDQAPNALWLLFGIGTIQQIILSFRKTNFIWWSICYFLGWLVGIILISSFLPNLNQETIYAQIIAGTLIGFIIGFFQWLIIRKSTTSGASGWIVISTLTTPALLVMATENQRYLTILTALIYVFITGISIDWLLYDLDKNMQRWPAFRSRFFGIQGILTLVLLLGGPAISYKTWQTRLLSESFVDISANSPWQNTHTQLSKGNRVVIQYWNGTWSIDPANPDDGRFTDANGVQGSTPQKYCDSCQAPIPTGTLGMLVATQDTSRIGFPVGDFLDLKVTRDGLLFLIINDNLEQLADNSGSITVKIQVYNQ